MKESRKVVLPQPEGPMTAIILAGSAKPVILLSNFLLSCAPKLAGRSTVTSSHIITIASVLVYTILLLLLLVYICESVDIYVFFSLRSHLLTSVYCSRILYIMHNKLFTCTLCLIPFTMGKRSEFKLKHHPVKHINYSVTSNCTYMNNIIKY